MILEVIHMKYQSQIEAWLADKEPMLLDGVSRLVSVRSVKGKPIPGAPFGPGPAAALAEALKLAEEWGLKDPTDHEGYVGTADLNGGETALHILGHLDVVNEGEGWTVTDPYTPRIVDGCIYGRGTDDDKGPVAVSMLAMKCVKDLGIPLRKNVRLIMGTDEESGSADIAHYFASHPFAPNTFSPDSGFPVVNIEKGGYRPKFEKNWSKCEALPRLAWFHGGIRLNILPADASCAVEGLSEEQILPAAEAVTAQTRVNFSLNSEDGLTIITAKGTASHAAFPQGGNNAITGLLALLDRLPLKGGAADADAIHTLTLLFPHGDSAGKALGVAQEDAVSHDLTLAFSLLEMDGTGLKGQFDARVPICATKENCADVAEAAFQKHGFTLSGEMSPAHHTPADSGFVRTLLACYENYTGLKGECLAIGGGTYVHSIPGGVAFGCSFPGFNTFLHGPNERARISDLMTSAKIFAQVIVELCG